MKIRVDNFKGTAPRVKDRSLAPGYAKEAVNARLRNTNLESPYGNEAISPDPITTTNTKYIYPYNADSGTPCWFHWSSSEKAASAPCIDVARGFVRGDAKERTYFTGTTAGPQVTDSDIACVTAAPFKYPEASYNIGMGTTAASGYTDAPLTLTSVQHDFTTITPTQVALYDGGDLGEFDQYNFVSGTADFQTGATIDVRANSGGEPAIINNAYKLGDTLYTQIDFDITFNNGNDPDVIFAYNLDENGTGWGVKLSCNAGVTSVTITPQPISEYQTPSASPAYSYATGTTVGSITSGVAETFTIKVRSNSSDLLNQETSKDIIITSTAGHSVTSSGSFENGRWGFIGLNGTSPQVTALNDITVYRNGEDAEITNYVYTMINGYGEESLPSLPSVDILKADDTKVLMTVPNNDLDTDDNISHIRIYRSATDSSGATSYLLVEDNPNDTSASPIDPDTAAQIYRDDSTLAEIGPDLLESFNWERPPSDGHSIVALANGIMLVASGNTVYPSVSFRPHAYPTEYRIAVDSDIVAMAALENQCVVLTGEGSYIIYGDDPSAMAMVKTIQRHGCISCKSVVNWKNYGIVYASPDGLVAVNSGGATLLTEGYVTKREWDSYYPDTIMGVVHDDVYYGWYDDGAGGAGFVFDPRQGETGFAQLDYYATAAYSNPYDDILYVVISDALYSVETDSANPLTYRWLSKRYLLPYPTSFEAMQVRGTYDAGDVTVKLFADDEVSPFFTKSSINSDIEFLVPEKVCRDICIELSGTDSIDTVEISTDMEELT